MYITLPIQTWLELTYSIACIRTQAFYDMHLNHRRINGPQTLFFKTVSLIEYDKTLLFMDKIQHKNGNTHMSVADILEMNEQLREQNTAVDKACAQLEKQVIELHETVLGI